MSVKGVERLGEVFGYLHQTRWELLRLGAEKGSDSPEGIEDRALADLCNLARDTILEGFNQITIGGGKSKRSS